VHDPINLDVGKHVGCRSRYTSERFLQADYDIEKTVLGVGMNGAVRRAVSRCDGCKYAVKTFSKIRLSKKAQQDMKNEAMIYLSVDHPHITQLEMIYEAEGEMHFVMEYMEGGELFHRLQAAGSFPEGAAARATRQMLRAVAYLHDRGVVHRDLKLHNFLYEKKSSDHLKLIDFGLAQFVDQDEKMTEACGSISYVAPEVLRRSYTKKADLWSIGVIVHALLTGRMLFSGSDDLVLQKILKGTPEYSTRFAKLSEPAQDFVRSLLTKDPDARLNPWQALDHPWLCGNQTESKRFCMDPKIVASLRNFARASACQRKVLLLVAWSLSAAEKALLEHAFLAIDQHNSGTISLQQFKAALEDKTDFASKREAEELFTSLDLNGSNSIEYREFLAAAMSESTKFQDGVLRRAFARFDRNGDGVVCRDELLAVLGHSCPIAEIEDFLGKADTNSDGKLCFDEFQAAVQGGTDVFVDSQEVAVHLEN